MSTKAKAIIAIIPARGGSKGIPGKNICPVGGKPLLAWSIEQARQTPQVSRVFVSTDSAEIAAVAREWGAEVVMRPPEISGDTASSESALIHALDYLGRAEGGNLKPEDQLKGERERANCQAPSAFEPQVSGFISPPCTPDLVVFLQPTSPLRGATDIQKAIETLENEQADSLFSACRVEGFVWRVEKDGGVRSFSYDHLNRPRRQDAPEDLIENGSIYIFKPWVLRQFNNRLGGKIAIYRMPAQCSYQIDEPADLELVEYLIASRVRSLSASDGERAGVRCPPSHVSFASDLRPQTSDLCKIKLLVLDFDGVLTDNRVLVQEDGTEAVYCSREDGLGLEMLRKSGRVKVVVISKEKNPVVAARCRKLGIECIQSCDDKLVQLKQKVESRKLKQEAIAYVGNDVNDLECLRWVGLPIAVCDAAPEVLAVAKWKTAKPGGHGAVREVCEAILAAKRPAPRA
jgi:N-acylneuraminate cytidylyltransferase